YERAGCPRRAPVELGRENALADAGLSQEKDADRAGGDPLHEEPPQLIHRAVPAEQRSTGVRRRHRSPERRIGLLHQERGGPSVGGKARDAELGQLLPGGDRRREAFRPRLGEGSAAIDEEHLVLTGAVLSENISRLDRTRELLVCRRRARASSTNAEHTELVACAETAAALLADPVDDAVMRVAAPPPGLGRHRPLKQEGGPTDLHCVARLNVDRLTAAEVAPTNARPVGTAQILDPDAVAEDVEDEMPA